MCSEALTHHRPPAVALKSSIISGGRHTDDTETNDIKSPALYLIADWKRLQSPQRLTHPNTVCVRTPVHMRLIVIQWRVSRNRIERLLISCLVFAGRFTEDFLVWERIGKSCSTAGATISQFVEARETLDAARRPPRTDLIPCCSCCT